MKQSTLLEDIKQQGLYRQHHVISERQHTQVKINQKNCINFCSNDYLSLSMLSELKQATIDAVNTYGVGSGASPWMSGYSVLHQQAEQTFAEFMQRDKAILFNSGFTANIGLMAALFDKTHTVAMDKFNHASLIDGLKLSGAKHLRYRHNDMQHLRQRINGELKGLVTEGVFSMQGTIADLKTLADISHEHQALLIVDDAHGVGVLGGGLGTVAHCGLTQKQVPLLVCPLGKAFAAQGAVIAGQADWVDLVLQKARSYCYSTAIPPMLAAASMASLQVLQQQSWRREKLLELIEYFQQCADELQLNCLPSVTPIQSIMIGDNEIALQLSEQLLQRGFFLKAIRPPTVPKGTARLRVTLNTDHTPEQIKSLLQTVTHCYDSLL